jgi:hypothetical protein
VIALAGPLVTAIGGLGARRRHRCILLALRNIEQCVWEHLYLGGDPAETLDLITVIESRIRRLKKEIAAGGNWPGNAL